MTLIVFIVDTTISMSVKNYRGCSTLDAAKSFIFEFIKMRSKDNVSKMTDKFCVITSEEYPRCIKEIKQLNREGALNEQLKVIKANNKQPFIENIYNAFQYVNLSRQASGIENYAYGRCPFYIDPVVFIALTDGTAVDDLPTNPKLESRSPQDYIREVYRWDQKFFGVVLRMGAEPIAWPNGGRIECDNPNIEKLSNLVGGTSFRMISHRQFIPCCETILQNIILPGITVKFVCPQIQNLRVNGEADSPETRLKKRLEMRPLTRVYVRAQANNKFSGNWPIPESYWYRRVDGLPPRTAYPVIHFGQEPVTSLLHTDFAFEKYELEPSPITDYMMERFRGSQDERQCLQIFIHNSGKNEGFGKPFGFLKMMSNGNGVNLFLMPYNYPVLYQLVQDLKNDLSVKDKPEWKRRMDMYMDNVPPYYMNNLRKAFAKYRIQGVALLDEGGTRQLYPQNLINHINSLTMQGREEKAKLQAALDTAIIQNSNAFQCAHLEVRESFREVAKEQKSKMEAPTKKERRTESRRDPRNVTPQPVEEELFVDPETLLQSSVPQRQHIDVHFAEERIRWAPSTYKYPLNLKGSELVAALPRMMANLKMIVRDSNIPQLEGGRPGVNIKLHHSEELHNLPVQQMGNYDEYVKAQIDIGMAPLRQLETQATRTHAFGNPFKTDKKNMSIDEVGEQAENNPAVPRDSMKNRRGRPQRRKAGPLAPNSLGEWREKRKSISERSSVVSDISYISDLDMEDLTELATTNHTNGYLEKQNGNGVEKDVVEFMDTCRLDDNLDVPQPKKKKARVFILEQNMSESDMKDRKKAVQELVRSEKSNDTVSMNAIKASVCAMSSADALDILELARRESLRFKRTSLAKELEQEKKTIEQIQESLRRKK